MGYRIFHARTPPLTTIQVVEFHWAGSVPVEIEEVRPPSQKMSSKKNSTGVGSDGWSWMPFDRFLS